MNPLVEHALVAAIIMAAISYLLVRFLHKRRAGKGCGGDCACGKVEKD
jgi:hypothetical protein